MTLHYFLNDLSLEGFKESLAFGHFCLAVAQLLFIEFFVKVIKRIAYSVLHTGGKQKETVKAEASEPKAGRGKKTQIEHDTADEKPSKRQRKKDGKYKSSCKSIQSPY